MAKTPTLQSVKAIMTENKKLVAALTQIMQVCGSGVALLTMAAAQHQKLVNENKRLKDENIKLAQQLAEIEAVLASQIVLETEAEIVISAKKPRKPSTRKPKTMAVMEETAALLSVHLPIVSQEEAEEEII